MSDQKSLPGPNAGAATRQDDASADAAAPSEPPGRRSRFGAATEGWEAYNSWLSRVRGPGSPSRQAVIAKALYSVSSYRNWAEQARDAFDEPDPARNGTPAARRRGNNGNGNGNGNGGHSG